MEEKQDIVETIFKSKATPATKRKRWITTRLLIIWLTPYTEDIKSQLGGYLCMEEKQDIVETIFKSKATPATKPLKRSHRSIELK